jgi:hypothetical protein
MLPLQPQRERKSTQSGSHAHSLADAGFLLAHGPVGAAGALAVPSSACCGAAGVVVVFDVGRLFMSVLALLAADA